MESLLKKAALGGLVLLLAVGALGLYLRSRHTKELASPEYARSQGLPIPVRTALAEETEAEEVIGATAVTVASETAILRLPLSRGLSASSPVSDLVLKAVHAHGGEQVRVGQLLFEVDDEIFRDLVAQRKLALDIAKADLERTNETATLNQKSRELDLASAEAEQQFRVEDRQNRSNAFDIAANLNKDKYASSIEYYDTRSRFAETKFRLTESNRHLERARNNMKLGLIADKKALAKAKNEVAAAAVDLRAAERDLALCRVQSPLDGFVTFPNDLEPVARSAVRPGDVLAQILKLQPVHVHLDCPQERSTDVYLGQPAEVVLDSFPGQTFNGTVVRISPQVSPDLRVLPVLVKVDNPENRIKAGVSGYVRLRRSKKTLAVPHTAVFRTGRAAQVFCVEDGRARLRPVRTGRELEGGLIEVNGGLSRGEEVVIFHGNFYRHGGSLTSKEAYLKDNDLVDPDWRKWTLRN